MAILSLVFADLFLRIHPNWYWWIINKDYLK
jgi:hypothetical protein